MTFSLIKLAPVLAAGLAHVTLPLASGQASGTVIPSRIIRVVEFEDRDRTYRVDLESGKVTYVGGEIEPVPPAPPKPNPPTPTFPDTFPPAMGERILKEWAAATKGDKKTLDNFLHAIDVTLSLAGGLGRTDLEIVADFAMSVKQACGNSVAGFNWGSICADYGVDTRDELIASLKYLKAVLKTAQ